MPQKHPNLLFLFTDQQRRDTLACYGNHDLHMPNLNRLAEQSVVFDDPYCTQPVCTPSRGTLMTGHWPFVHGATSNNKPLRHDTPCLPELLPADRRDSYATGYMGKWHLGDETSSQHGFDEWVSVEDQYFRYASGGKKPTHSSYHHFLVENGFQPDISSEGHARFSRESATAVPEAFCKPHFLATRASNFIEQHQDQPWMLVVNFLEPHPPFNGPRDKQYDPKAMKLPANCYTPLTDDQPEFLRRTKPNCGITTIAPPHDELRQVMARYWGLNSLVDTHIGRILDTLDATGQRENTLIVFTSDHGEMMGAHGLLHKGVMFKESTRIPMMIQLPGQKTQGRITGPVSQLDLAPTLLDLLGTPEAGHHLPGKSLANLCEAAANGETVSAVDVASPCVIAWNPDQNPKVPCQSFVRTLITPRGERFTQYAHGEQELYNLQDDPDETRNLAGEPAMQDRVRQLQSELVAWLKTTNDPAELFPTT